MHKTVIDKNKTTFFLLTSVECGFNKKIMVNIEKLVKIAVLIARKFHLPLRSSVSAQREYDELLASTGF